MTPSKPFLRLALPLVAVLLQGCLLKFEGGDFQNVSLHFTLTEALPQGEDTLVQILHQPHSVGIKKRWVRISGSLMLPDGAPMPSRLNVTALVEEVASGKQVLRFKTPVTVAKDGNFVKAKKFKKDLPAGSMQSISVQPLGAAIPAGTMVWLCVDVAGRKADLKQIEDCRAKMSAPPGDDLIVVEVLDNVFSPKRVQASVGQTVRWVLNGLDSTHTVTARNSERFDFKVGSLPVQGATVEVTFTQADDNKTFEYFCETHHDCCEMQGSVQVGNDAPDPDDRY